MAITKSGLSIGIVFVSITATYKVIQQLYRAIPLVCRLYSPDDEELYLWAIGADRKRNYISRLSGAKEVPVSDPLPLVTIDKEDRLETDLDTSWDGINFCVKRLVAKDVLNIFEDGKSIYTIELGYGPTKSFLSHEIQKIAEAYS